MFKLQKFNFRGEEFEFAYDVDSNLGGVDWDRIVEWCIRHVEPTDVFIDVGAQIGYMGVLTSRFARPKHSIFCEGDPRTIPLLEHNASKYAGSYEIVDKLILDKEGEHEFFINIGNPAQSSIYDRSKDYGTEKVKVASTTIDAIAPKDTPIVLKIDVEFAEPQVWLGMQETLPNVRAMIMEVHHIWLRDLAKTDSHGFIERIKEAGFTHSWFDSTNVAFYRE